MKKLTAKMACKIALKYIKSDNIEQAEYVLKYWTLIKLDFDNLVILDESSNKEYVSLCFKSVDI